MSYTPGPWTVDKQGEKGTQQLPIRAGGKIIAAIRDEGRLEDARLIAAAPLAYENHKRIVANCNSALKHLVQGHFINVKSALLSSREFSEQAISQAEGETP